MARTISIFPEFVSCLPPARAGDGSIMAVPCDERKTRLADALFIMPTSSPPNTVFALFRSPLTATGHQLPHVAIVVHGCGWRRAWMCWRNCAWPTTTATLYVTSNPAPLRRRPGCWVKKWGAPVLHEVSMAQWRAAPRRLGAPSSRTWPKSPAKRCLSHPQNVA